MIPDLWFLYLLLLLGAGAMAGFLAGLLGIGGGMVLVPVLDTCFAAMGIPVSERVHLAVGTSMACIVPTALVSARRHHQRGAVDQRVALRWGPACALGAILGSLIAIHLDGRWLAATFGVLAILAGLHGLWSRGRNVEPAPSHGRPDPVSWPWWPVPLGIGGVSAMMGIGGGTFSVPVLRAFGFRVHQAVGTSAWLGAWIALPSTLGYLLASGTGAQAWGYRLGHVDLLALAVLVPATVWTVPLGVGTAHRWSQRKLGLAFGLFLLLAGGRMLQRAFG
ncbi:MAG: sulfite exporter TauE/SafE family protein [Steroidobacteraceae bacterium]